MKRCLILTLMLMLMLAMGCGGPGRGKDGPPPDGQAPPPQNMDQKRDAPPKELTPQERLDRRIQDLVKILVLTPEQTGQVRDILGRADAQKQALEPEGGRWDNPDAMSKYFLRLRRIDQRATEELSTVLNKDQLEDYQDYMEDQRFRPVIKRGKKGGPKGPGGKGEPPSGRD